MPRKSFLPDLPERTFTAMQTVMPPLDDRRQAEESSSKITTDITPRGYTQVAASREVL